MKDFYKILGVKETASEEEIRARWVELTKHYHPDRGEEIASDEKIREINEAYQILKHSSTRVEYDLKRTYGQKRRGSYFKKLGIPATILMVLIIFGGLYLLNYLERIDPTDQKNRNNPIDERDQIALRNQTNQTNQKNQIDLSREMPLGSLSHRDQTNQKDQKTQSDVPAQQPKAVASIPALVVKRHQTNQIGERDQRNQRNQIDQINQIDVPAQQPKIAKAAPAVPIKQHPTNQMGERDQRNQRNQMDQIDPTNQRNQIDQVNQNDVPAQQPKIAKATPAAPIKQDQTDQIDQTNLKVELAQFKPPSLLATEGEVKKFFDKYIEHYNQMDLEGFLSLFSTKAIQNKKDGPEGIRKVYTIFFNQGKEVRCRFRDMKIEIYQNVVEAKARYEIIQILMNSENRGFWKGQIQWVLVKENEAFKIVSLDYQHD